MPYEVSFSENIEKHTVYFFPKIYYNNFYSIHRQIPAGQLVFFSGDRGIATPACGLVRNDRNLL